MIIDSLKHIDLYTSLHPSFEKAAAFLKSLDGKVENGKYELDGNRLYATIANMNTSPLEGRDLEAHRKYIDLHYILEGEELMEYADIQYLFLSQEYDADKDVCFYSGNGSAILCRKGDFYIVYPQDGHKPCGASGNKPLRKVIFKIAYEF